MRQTGKKRENNEDDERRTTPRPGPLVARHLAIISVISHPSSSIVKCLQRLLHTITTLLTTHCPIKTRHAHRQEPHSPSQKMARPSSVQAVLFDMDGILADVAKSYRAAIVEVRMPLWRWILARVYEMRAGAWGSLTLVGRPTGWLVSFVWWMSR